MNRVAGTSVFTPLDEYLRALEAFVEASAAGAGLSNDDEDEEPVDGQRSAEAIMLGAVAEMRDALIRVRGSYDFTLLDEYLRVLEAFVEASAVAHKEKRLSGSVRKIRSAARKMFSAQRKRVLDELKRNTKIVEEAKRELADWDEEDLQDLLDGAFEETIDEFVEALQDAMRQTMEIATEDVSTQVGIDLRIDFDLGVDRTEAIAYLDAHGAAHVAQINETTRSTIQRIVTEGVADAKSYTQVASELRAAFASMSRYRATLIAVTEAGNAYEHATQHVAQTIQGAGINIEKYWSNVGDENVTDGCLENTAAGWMPIGRNFPSGHSRPLRFPGCRCTALYRQAKGQ